MVVMCLTLAACIMPAGATSWDLAGDWGLASNPNGVWTYGMLDAGGTWTIFPKNILFDVGGTGMPAWGGDYPWSVPCVAMSIGAGGPFDLPAGHVFAHTPAPGGTGDGGYVAAMWDAPPYATMAQFVANDPQGLWHRALKPSMSEIAPREREMTI